MPLRKPLTDNPVAFVIPAFFGAGSRLGSRTADQLSPLLLRLILRVESDPPEVDTCTWGTTLGWWEIVIPVRGLTWDLGTLTFGFCLSTPSEVVFDFSPWGSEFGGLFFFIFHSVPRFSPALLVCHRVVPVHMDLEPGTCRHIPPRIKVERLFMGVLL